LIKEQQNECPGTYLSSGQILMQSFPVVQSKKQIQVKITYCGIAPPSQMPFS